MDTQTLINISAGALLAAVGWVLAQAWREVKTMQNILQELRVHIPANYVARSEFRDSLDRIEAISERIFDKLDRLEERKADKNGSGHSD